MGIHFPSNSLQAMRGLAGDYMRSRAGVRRRAQAVYLYWFDSFHEVHGQVPWYSQFVPGRYVDMVNSYTGGSTGGLNDSWRYHIVMTLKQQERWEIYPNYPALNIPGDPYGYVTAQTGMWTSAKRISTGPIYPGLDCAENFGQSHFRCFGQLNIDNHRFPNAAINQGLIVGSAFQMFEAVDFSTYDDPFVNFYFICPRGQIPSARIDGGGGAINRTQLIKMTGSPRYTGDLWCLVSTNNGHTTTQYTASGFVPEDWGYGFYPLGQNGSYYLIRNYGPSGTEQSEPVDFWKLSAWPERLIPAATYDLHFVGETPGVACLGGSAIVETVMPIQTGSRDLNAVFTRLAGF